MEFEENVKRAFGPRLGPWGASTAAAADKPVALIIAQGGLGDQSYNDLAYAGFKKALAETKLQGKAVESKDVVAQAADILRRASDAGFGLVVDLEYSHGDALTAVAKDYAGTDYVILNQVRPGANVASVLFQEQEGSYLAGALATLVAEGCLDQGHERQADHRRHRRHQVGRHRQIHRRLHPGRARNRSEGRSEGRLFQQFRRSGDRIADGKGDVRRRRQRRLSGRRRHPDFFK